MYAVGALHIYLMLMIMIYCLSHNIAVYDRERMGRWYGPIPHLVSGILFSAPPNILYSVGESLCFVQLFEDSTLSDTLTPAFSILNSFLRYCILPDRPSS